MAEPTEGNYQESLPDEAEVYVVNRKTGERGVVPRGKLDVWKTAGYELETPEQIQDAALEKEYGDSAGQALLEGAARGITLGLSDATIGQLDEEGFRERRERNAGAATVGEIGGALLSTGVGLGGAVTATGKAAGAATAAKAGGGLGGKLLVGGTRGATEGVFYGAGAGVSEVALSKDPVDWESAASTIGSNALGGAVIGGGIGVGAKLLEEGAVAAKGYAARKLEAMKGPEPAVDRSQFPDIAGMDKKVAREALVAEKEAVRAQRATDIAEGKVARDAEVEVLERARDAEAATLHKEASAYGDFLMDDPAAFIPTSDRKVASILKNSKMQIVKPLDDATGFIEQRGIDTVRKGLRRQEGALNKVLADADDVLANAGAERQTLLDSLPQPSKLPKFGELSTEAPTVVTTTARDLERAGLFELPGAGVDATRMARVRANLGKIETETQPIRLTMDPEGGGLFIDDGRHRLRAALEEGGTRPIQVEIDRGVPGILKDTAQLGTSGGYYLTPEQAKLYRTFTGAVPLKKGVKAEALAVTPDELSAFRSALESGDIHPPGVQRVLGAQELLQRNQALQAKFAELRKPVASDRLAAIDKRIEEARAGLGKTPRQDALEAHIADLSEQPLGRKVARGIGAIAGGKAGFMVGGPVGAAAGGMAGQELGARVYDKLVRKIGTGNAAKARSIKASVATVFATGAERGAKAVAKAAPLASRILPSIRYTTPEYADSVLGPANAKPSKSPLVNEFRARARELNAMTERRPDGTYTVRMPAREQLNARLQALWAIDPDFANGVEKAHNARLEFLASKLPRDPSPPHLQAGPDTWEPSRADLAKFARYMEAAESPERVLQRFAAATMTPEDAEALRTVYPQLYAQVQEQVYQHMAELRTSLPYAKRLALSIYLDTPVDPALTSEALSVYQRPAPPPQSAARPQGPAKSLPTGQVEPTRAQRFSS